MQVSKDYIRDSIIEASKSLFLRKGYNKVSMREIADKSKVGLSNIYNYFENKNDLFRVVVQPALNVFKDIEIRHTQESMRLLDIQSDKFIVQSFKERLARIKNNKEAITILLFHSQGSSYEKFREEFTDRLTKMMRESFASQKMANSRINVDVTDFSLRMHIVWQFTLMEELIKNKVPMRELDKIIDECVRFETYGWRELLRV